MDGHRVSMLGTGLIGDFYTSTLHRGRGRDRVEVVYSRSPERGAAFAKRWDVPQTTSDLRAAVEHADTDVVVVGLPNHLHAEAVGLAAAVRYLEAIGMDRVRAHERLLTAHLLDRLSEIEAVRVLGPADLEQRGGVVSFTLGEVHPHDVAQVLDAEGIAVRAGDHCAKPLHRRFGLGASTRASVYVYNTTDEVDALATALDKAQRMFA